MKKLIIYLLLFVSFQHLYAQDEAIFSHYLVNPQLINPAFTGFNGKQNINMNIRSGYISFPGTPKTYSLSWNGPVTEHIGLGALILTENISSFKRFKGQLSYAYRYQLENMKFSIGLSTEFHQMRVSNGIFNNVEVDPNDNSLIDITNGVKYFDASLGVMGEYNSLYFGLSAPNLVQARLNSTSNTSGDSDTKLFSYVVAQVGNRFNLKTNGIVLDPSIVLRKVKNSPLFVDFNVKASFLNNKLISGITYRAGTGGGIGLMIGTRLNSMGLFYTFDSSFQRFQSYNGGSHEFTINFELGKGANSKKTGRGLSKPKKR
ncbi:MAG: PorP/SprF family type IX secretion system membrane protein [Saprospiraceae bacterium]|nr:PorP/SprF family type IX secretion system membrane protein [Saprospiraceae bacterium]